MSKHRSILTEDNYTNDEISIIKKCLEKKPQEHKFSLLYNDHVDELPYRQRLGQFKIPIHNGQRKLLLSSLLFLTQYSYLSTLVVYAGASPGTNIIILAKLYGNIRFHLYDPRPFDKRLIGLKNVKLYQSYFTDEIAKKYSKKNCMLWSDIRTGTVEDEDFEDQVIENNNMQKRWHDLVKPVMGMYKFRLPYVISDKSSEGFYYMKGDIWLQMWAPTTSTETRLIVKRDYEMIQYNNESYEKRMYYFNTIDRQWKTYHKNSKFDLMDVPCNCYDCTGEKEILLSYLLLVGKHSKENLLKLSNCITSYLGSVKHLHHGYIDLPIWDKYVLTLKLFKEKVLKERENKIKIRKIHYDSNATKLIKEH